MKPVLHNKSTDLPVLLPFRPGAATWDARDWAGLATSKRFGLALALVLISWLLIDTAYAQMVGAQGQTVWETIVKWTPLMFLGPEGEFGGFVLNIVVSFIAMALGTFLGLWLGLGQVSPNRFIRRTSWAITQLFRNSPWLVLLFYFMLLIPFFIRIGDTRIEISGWAKATFALSLPIMANVSEIVRGSIALHPDGPVGLGREPCLFPQPDPVAHHPAAMHQAHDPAMDELVLHPDHVDAAGLDSRRQ